MKALLIEDSRLKKNFSALVLSENGKINQESSPFISISLGRNDFVFVELSYDQLCSFEKILEFDIDEDLVLKILDTCVAKVRYNKLDLALRIALQNKIIKPNCDLMSYLEFGSVLL